MGDWANMGADCKRLEDAGVDRIQFDVMDGNFVPNLTFGPEMIGACRKYTKVPFETQLMVSNYNCDTMLKEYVEATKGPNCEPGVVIAHVEANVHLHRTLDNIRKMGVDRGLDFDIEVDGGVKADWTIAQCADAGANCFIAGSGIFAYDDLSEGCEALRKVATAAQNGDIME